MYFKTCNTSLTTLATLLILFSTVTLTFAQDAPPESDLILQVRTDDNATTITWLPVQPEQWNAQLSKGYQLIRTETDQDGKAIGSPQTLGQNILPKDTTWFNQNGHLVEDMMSAIGAILHGEAFTTQADGQGMSIADKHSYIVAEAENYSEVATAVGLGFLDNTRDKNKTYQYVVKSMDGQLMQTLIASAGNGFTQEPATQRINYQWPNNTSLSKMLSQMKPAEEVNRIALITRTYGDSIVLRWGPTTPKLWGEAMRNGYEIYRQISADSTEKVADVFPWKEEQFTESILEDSMALAAAAILQQYGKKQADLDPLERAMVFETQFGFALYAADRSAFAADILGLRYVDKNVVEGASYLYTIRTKTVPSPFFWGESLAKNVSEAVNAPVGLEIIPGDQSIKLEWGLAENKFSAYVVERSEDGQNFEVLTENPLVFASTKDVNIIKGFYQDEAVENNKKYYYRIKGSTSFGNWSDYATIEGQASDLTPPAAPYLNPVKYDQATKIFSITWEDNAPAADLAGYQVLLADEYDGVYGAISEVLEPGTFNYEFKLPEDDQDRDFNFKISSIDELGNTSQSDFSNAIVPDLIAPEPPTVLEGFIDSTGIVTVSWEPSSSKDTRGYWLYWSDRPDQEMTIVNDKLIEGLSHSWQIEKVTLNKKIYFCLRAEDNVYNRGVVSEVIEVKRPDYVPPVTPFITAVTATDTTTVINWNLSSSTDVKEQFIYRKNITNGEVEWEKIQTVSATATRFEDVTVRIGQSYNYAIKAIDDSGNLSEISNSKSAAIAFPFNNVLVSNFNIDSDKASTDLLWEFAPSQKDLTDKKYQFDIFRSTGGGALEYYTSSPTPSFKDEKVNKNVLYNYAVRVHFDNGWTGDLSEVKSVIIQ